MREELISDYADSKNKIEKRGSGNREKAMRVARGLDIEDIAPVIGISVKQLTEIENGGEFSYEQNIMLAKYYGVSLQFMLGGINDSYVEEGLL